MEMLAVFAKNHRFKELARNPIVPHGTQEKTEGVVEIFSLFLVVNVLDLAVKFLEGGFMISSKLLKKYLPLSALLLLSGCDTTESTLGGAALGTAAGAGIGYAFGGKGGAVAGGAIGALGGGALGHNVGRKNEAAKEKEAYAEENARLRAQNSALLAEENNQRSLRKEIRNDGRDDEIRQMNHEIEKKRLENERLKLEIEREAIRANQAKAVQE